MAIQDNCVLWNKMENAALVSEPGYGPNGVVIGAPTFPPTKFNNGIYGTIGNYCTFANIYPVGASIFEFWWKPSFASGASASNFMLQGTGGDRIQIANISAAISTFSIYAYVGGARRCQYRHKPAWAANSLNHVLVVVNSVAGPTNRLKLYLNGAFVNPTAYTDDNAFVFSAAETIAVGTDNVGNRPSLAAIDNLKIYNSIADLVDILANRENEGWPEVGGKHLIDGWASPQLKSVLLR